jgi:hypothetical protein
LTPARWSPSSIHRTARANGAVLAERLGTTRVFTLDRRDFGVYRVGKRRFEIVL